MFSTSVALLYAHRSVYPDICLGRKLSGLECAGDVVSPREDSSGLHAFLDHLNDNVSHVVCIVQVKNVVSVLDRLEAES